VSGRAFKSSLDHSKSQFFEAFNAIPSKVGRLASEDVVLSLLPAKCLPILFYFIMKIVQVVHTEERRRRRRRKTHKQTNEQT